MFKTSAAKRASSARYRAANPKRVAAIKRDWAQRNTEKMRAANRASYIKRTYSMTSEEYDARLQEQAGVCAICHEVQDKPLHQDHDHETGKLRGLLCFRCNTALGNFRDSPLVLESAIQYLHEHS